MTFTGLIGRICMFPLRLIINTCVALGIHPNVLTFMGVLINVAAAFELARGHFIRGDDGAVRWLRLGGRLYRRA